jgi:hypothetical protein
LHIHNCKHINELKVFLHVALVLFLFAVAAFSAAAQTPLGVRDDVSADAILTAEFELFGTSASALWLKAQSETGGIGGIAGSDQGSGGGLAHKAKAGFLSLILPGAGQFYNGDRSKAYIFAGVEAAVWAAYLTFDTQGDNRSDTYREYAGIYAGAGGSHTEAYWQAVGRYMDSDSYNEALRREARALREQPQALIGPNEAWQWRNSDHLRTYQELRADANRSFDRRDFMTLFAVVNRAVAVYDAVRSSVDDRLSTRILGFDVALEVSPSLSNPRTECLISRSF